MPRRTRPSANARLGAGRRGALPHREFVAGRALAAERVEPGPPWDPQRYVVRSVAAAQATKVYRCPGCDQLIPPGTAHVVVWPAEHGSIDDRRHWHIGCWRERATRRLTRRWS